MPVLLLKTTGGRFVEAEVGDRAVIGRGADCDLRIDDALVSRRHAEVVRRGDEHILRDLGSRNGTRLNGVLVSSVPLAFGDTVHVGSARVLFARRAPSALVGTTLAGYEVLKQIGSGGMGVVYRARQITLDRLVALKVLHPRLVAHPTFVGRFLREARAAGTLNHINLVHVHDAGRCGDSYYYAMEFVDGHTVSEELRRHGPLPAVKALDVALHTATALAYAHAHGIIHRDVKPGNIMLARDGAVKLADLGLATSTTARGPDLDRGLDGKLRVWGTPSYMPPEVALGLDADLRSDLYSLGATLFHMLTGRVPFIAGASGDILLKQVREPIPGLQDVAAVDIPRAINPLVERLMAKRPERRYQTADQLIADLRVVREIAHQIMGDEETRLVPTVAPDLAPRPGLLRRLLRAVVGRGPSGEPGGPPNR